MTNQEEEALEKFRTLATEWATHCRWEEHTSLAIRGHAGWHLRYYLTILRPFELNPIPERIVRTNSIVARRYTTKIEPEDCQQRIAEFLANDSKRSVAGVESSLSIYSDWPIKRIYNPHQPPFLPGALRIPFYAYVGHELPEGATTSAVEIDFELRASNPPYNALADLNGEFAILPDYQNLKAPGLIGFAIFCPFLLALGELTNKTLSVQVKLPSTCRRELLSLGLITLNAVTGPFTRDTIQSETFDWLEHDGDLQGSISRNVGDSPIAIMLPTYDGENLAQFTARDSKKTFNRLLQLHRLIDVEDKASV